MSDAVWIGGFLAVSAAAAVIYLLGKRFLVRGLLFSGLAGVGTLWLVSMASPALGLGVTLNPLTGAVGALYGVPGVVGLLLLRLLCG